MNSNFPSRTGSPILASIDFAASDGRTNPAGNLRHIPLIGITITEGLRWLIHLSRESGHHRKETCVGWFSKREANELEREIWGTVNITDEFVALGRVQVEQYIGPTTPEYDQLEQGILDAAADFNQAYAAKEWQTLGVQNDAWNAAMRDQNAYMEANNYKERIGAAKAEEGK
jgi:hypothetical protein